MNILVIEDARWNQKYAFKTLNGHDVTLARDIKEAHDALSGADEYDAVLTDLHLPRGGWTGSVVPSLFNEDEPNLVDSLPAGLVFALKSVNMGIPAVILTDSNHHDDWFCGLLDLIGTSCRGGQVAYVEARTASAGRLDEETGEAIDPRDYHDESKSVTAEDIPPEDAPTVKDWARAMELSGLFPDVTFDG